MSKFTDYQYLVIAVMIWMNLLASGFAWFIISALLKYSGFRDATTEAVQNGDEKFHWIDYKNVSFLIAGFFSALFTMNITGIIVFAKAFEAGAIAIIVLFSGITFTLFGIAWRQAT